MHPPPQVWFELYMVVSCWTQQFAGAGLLVWHAQVIYTYIITRKWCPDSINEALLIPHILPPYASRPLPSAGLDLGPPGQAARP